jgi:hypothetical protein
MTNDLCEPWSLHFDRDGTEDFGIICDANGQELVASHLPCTRIAERTFQTGTFWRPEANDPTPMLMRQLWLMTAAPKLVAALETAQAMLEEYKRLAEAVVIIHRTQGDDLPERIEKVRHEAGAAIREARGEILF